MSQVRAEFEAGGKGDINLIDNKDGGMPRTTRPCATVGLYCPGSAMGDEVGDPPVNTNSDGVLGVCFFLQIAGNLSCIGREKKKKIR